MSPFSKVQGTYESQHRYLQRCHLYHCDIAGVDSEIFFEAMKLFVQETEELRGGENKLLLIISGYAAHVQYSVIKFLKENGIVVIGLLAHTSHVLQPLDVSVFSAYKSYLQRYLPRAMREKRTLDACHVGNVIRLDYSASFTVGNIMSGFKKSGLWYDVRRLASEGSLKDLPIYQTKDSATARIPSIQEVEESCNGKCRTLLRNGAL